MFEKKKLAKRRAEEEKEARKRKCIEAKEKKDKLVPAATTVKRKLFTKPGVDSLAPVVIKLSHPNLGGAYIAMILTMPTMKNIFQNTIRSKFPFLKMEMNSSVTRVTNETVREQ